MPAGGRLHGECHPLFPPETGASEATGSSAGRERSADLERARGSLPWADFNPSPTLPPEARAFWNTDETSPSSSLAPSRESSLCGGEGEPGRSVIAVRLGLLFARARCMAFLRGLGCCACCSDEEPGDAGRSFHRRGFVDWLYELPDSPSPVRTPTPPPPAKPVLKKVPPTFLLLTFENLERHESILQKVEEMNLKKQRALRNQPASASTATVCALDFENTSERRGPFDVLRLQAAAAATGELPLGDGA
ncbi:hypothetical protein DIPPA_34615 [Diplonema papillatum]|nr:hypothetical protein DIPPA_34615 [Diplonema papillatum]